MKTLLLSAALAGISLCINAQTKGTKAVGFGITLTDSESKFENQTSNQTNQSYSLTYGNFIRENVKLSLTALYGHSESNGSNSGNESSSDSYGGRIAYQKYFPVVKKFFVFADAGAGFSHRENRFNSIKNSAGKQYSLGSSGGVAYFLNKRLAFEAKLLSANIIYETLESIDSNFDAKTNQKIFDFSSSGSLNNMAFQIYFLF